MRNPTESRARWNETLRQSSSFTDMQRAVKFNGPSNPCVAGCRSVCWKTFLLLRDVASSDWSQVLSSSRMTYATNREQHLRYIKHPEQLAALSFDPLADDPDSPWHVVRRDELMRAEILQDVQRLPDEPFYHTEVIQTMILDILFLYCKLQTPTRGYRQGMHELLAPIVYVVHEDAIEREAAAAEGVDDAAMLEMLDASYIEHDAYALFSALMGSASAFYEIGTNTAAGDDEQNAIVEKSKYIHESLLMKIDPELANHLKNLEILPQIFLIRWMRLLFGREFPFDQLLVLWDTIFAFDPSLALLDYVCVAMLIRVRWKLLEADYTVALQLLLRYPAPAAPHGPHTFVDDAVYLRDHCDIAGGATLIMKYTGRQPATVPSSKGIAQATTPNLQSLGSLRQRTLGARSPLASTARILQQPGGVEALLQSASKNVMERSEKLGINQAVRDAMGEIRRNVQNLQDARTTKENREPLGDDRAALEGSSVALAFMERRNKQLAAMLGETIDSLKTITAATLQEDKENHLQIIEIAAAKTQLVKVYLEDSSLSLPEREDEMEADLPPIDTLAISLPGDIGAATVALDTTPVVMTSAVDVVRSSLSPPSPDRDRTPRSTSPQLPEYHFPEVLSDPPDRMDMDILDDSQIGSPTSASKAEISDSETSPRTTRATMTTAVVAVDSDVAPATPKPRRPSAPIPTRSTLAQSSFAWMLEPDMTHIPSSPPLDPFGFRASGVGGSGIGGGGGGGPPKKRGLNSASRERNAFLFGEVTGDAVGDAGPLAEEIFGLKPIRIESRTRHGPDSRSGSLSSVVEEKAGPSEC